MIEITALKGMPAAIGYIGENEHRVVVFPEAAEILAMYPGASVTVMHMRPGDRDAYPVSPQYIEVANGVVKWTIQSGDLARQGNGKCEVIISCGDVVAKTMIYKTVISPAIGGGEAPPDPWTGWTENVRDSADLARGYADGKHLDGSDNTSLNENNAKYHAQQAEAAAGHYPKIESGTWWVWDVQSGAFVDTHITAQGPAGVGVPSGGTTGQVLKKKSGTDYDTEWSSEPSVPVQDVQVNGTSILNQGVANVPIANAINKFGVIKVNGDGLNIRDTGQIYVNVASEALIKSAGANYNPIAPARQHLAVFYGLATAAGDTTQSASSNAVGTYTDAAKVAIQKMLGIYQAPWELIREDTVTNATSSDIEISVDGNGEAFELTDIVLLFETPQQETASSANGDIYFFYGASDYLRTASANWTQNAGASPNGIYALIDNKSNMIMASCLYRTSPGYSAFRTGYGSNFEGANMSAQYIPDFKVTSVSIKSVTGTGHYKLYGKRKWN